MDKKGPEIMIVAGEASGDRLGAELAKEIIERAPNALCFGAAGPMMRAAGVESVMDSDTWSIVGVGAVARAVPKFLKILAKLSRLANERRPAAVVLIDFPEFNLKLARRLKKDGHKVIYYVSPQVWAWRRYRIKTIRDSVDLLLSILPFEKQWYVEQGIDHVEFVGNPIVERVKSTRSKEEVFERHGLDPKKKLIVLLPGSRRKEIGRHLGVMIKAARNLRSEMEVQFAIAAANSDARSEIEQILDLTPNFQAPIVEGETYDLLNACDAAAISSGTATLEAAILGTPMVVVYKLPKTDYMIFKPFVDVPHVALINLIAGRRLVTELIQADFNDESLAAELKRLLLEKTNREIRSELREAVSMLRVDLGTPKAADLVLKFLSDGEATEGQRNFR